MDIFNRPPSISEDTLHYTIYPPLDSSDKTSVTTLAAFISNHVNTALPNFLWHRDVFEVKLIVSDQDNTGSCVLEGRMRVGDCVDDEWCAVWLLKDISSKWDVAIRVYDSDGEFLLIEGADELPSWVKPTNSENRVWIYNSRIHLILLSYISPESRKKSRPKLPGATDSDDEDIDSESFIAVEDAVQLVRDPSVDTLAPSGLEKVIWQRISGYPASTKSHVHVTKAHLPVDIAKVLSVYPSLVQKAVETFYTRDTIQLRTAHRMSRFSPGTCVLTSIKLTRTAYAQLVGQKFFPPKVFGQWKEVEGTPEWRWRDVGMKIAVGFEMLYQESKGRPNSQNVSAEGIKSSAEANKEGLRRNPEYQKYIKNLVSVGYFKDELEGSELWNEFENKAAIIFLEVRRTDDATRQSFASQVDQGLASVQCWPTSPVQEEDNDDWLNIDAQEFDQSLEATLATGNRRNSNAMDVDSPSQTEFLENKLASEQAKRLKDLATKVENFVEGEGDLEGVKFEDEDFSDEPFSDDEESSDSEEDEETKLAAKKAAMDSLVPALKPSEYGQMPATYHRNSQRVAPATSTIDAVDINPEKKSAEAQTVSNVETRPMRPPIIPRDKYDGIDSDDETDEEELDDESEDDHPQVVGDIEIDMEEEEEEFLEFSRQVLGINDEQWQEIVKDRKDRGAFLPHSAINESPITNTAAAAEKAEKSKANIRIARVPEPGPRPNVNPELDSFEAVMKALDAELLRSKKPSSDKGKGKAKEDSDKMTVDIDIEAAMDAELEEALQDIESDSEEPVDYNMIKNFLESYKSQAGLSGPVSNLVGMLQPGMKLPRDS